MFNDEMFIGLIDAQWTSIGNGYIQDMYVMIYIREDIYS